jgi:hypothetical protein
VGNLEGLPHQLMALPYGTLHPALTGRKEQSEKSQSREYEAPQSPALPNMRPTCVDKMQSVRANPSPAEEEQGGDTEGTDRPKGIASYLRKKELRR